MKTRYTVSKAGWGREEESHEMMANVGSIDKTSLVELLNGNVFFASKKDAKEFNSFSTPIKRKVTITVVITDVVPKEKKK